MLRSRTEGPQPIALPHNQDDLDALGQRICDQIRLAERARQARLDRVDAVRTIYRHDETRPEKDKPWASASDVQLPAAYWIINRYAAQILSTVFGTHPIYNVEGQRRVDDEHADAVEQFLEGLITQIVDLEMVMDPGVLQMLRDGSAAIHVGWRREEEYIARWAIVQDEETGEVEFDEDEVKEVVYDGPDITVFPVEQYGVYPADARSIQQAHGAWVVQSYSGNELLQMADDGFVDNDALDLVKKNPQSDAERVVGDALRETRDLQPAPYANDDFIEQPVEVYQCYWRVQTDKKRPAKDWYIWVHLPSNTILHAEEMPVWSRQRPLVLLRAFPDPEGGVYGDSIGEMVYDLQLAMTALLRQCIDEAAIRIHTPLAMDPMAKVQGAKYEYAPGAVWEVYDVAKLKPIVEPNTHVSSGLPMIQYLLQTVDRLTGISDNQLGMSTSDRQTATESQVLENNAAVLFNFVIQRVRASMKELATHLFGFCYQYAGNESVQALWERLVGEGQNPFMLAEQVMRGRYFFTAAGTTAQSSRALKQAMMREIYERLLQNPLVASNPLRMFALTRRYLTEMGIRVPEEIIGKEEDIKQAMAEQAQARMALMAQEEQQQVMAEQAQSREDAMAMVPAAVGGALNGGAGGNPSAMASVA